MSFIKFKEAVEAQFSKMSKNQLLKSSVSNEEIWDTYLSSFPEGTNPMFRERTEHDCNCCKNFVRNLGKVVVGKGESLETVWDVTVPEPFQTVANALSELIKSKSIENEYLSTEPQYGSKSNKDNYSDVIWDHFFAKVPRSSIVSKNNIGTKLGSNTSNKEVLARSVLLSEDAVDTVIELIDQNSIYRGEEHKNTVSLLKQCMLEYSEAINKEVWLWEKSLKLGPASRIKNTVIGTLISDLSDGVDLTRAVKSFESKVAPANYKRPTALVTKSMIDKAQKKVEELGFMDSLSRTHANINDITINNVLFANREAKKQMNVFDELKKSTKSNPQNFDKVEEITITDFIEKVLPKAENIEAYFENKHAKNLVTLVAPSDKSSKNMLQWDNNFTWTYNGDVTDSMDQRVKDAGGSVDGILRLSLAWEGKDDLDIHVYTPNGKHISFSNKSADGGKLDVDANAVRIMSNPVENVVWKSEPPKGKYRVTIDNFTPRDVNSGYNLNLVVGGEVFRMNKDSHCRRDDNVLEFEYLGNGQVKILSNKLKIDSDRIKTTAWGIDSLEFHKVKVMMLSPNHWDDNSIGNKHFMFMLENCENPDDVRGFYNEFLSNDLIEHRKVFEMLASKMKASYNKDQLSGIGFSSTKRDELIVKVSGSFNRLLKIKF